MIILTSFISALLDAEAGETTLPQVFTFRTSETHSWIAEPVCLLPGLLSNRCRARRIVAKVETLALRQLLVGLGDRFGRLADRAGHGFWRGAIAVCQAIGTNDPGILLLHPMQEGRESLTALVAKSLDRIVTHIYASPQRTIAHWFGAPAIQYRKYAGGSLHCGPFLPNQMQLL